MGMINRVGVVAMFLVGFVGGAVGARGEIAQSPASYTDAKYRKDVLAINRKTLVDAYKEVGHRDPKWDDQAIKFLEQMALWFTYSARDTPLEELPAAPLQQELSALGKAALDAGCDDVLVRYCCTRSIDKMKMTLEARDLYRELLPLILNSPYPAQRRFSAVSTMMKRLEGERSRPYMIAATKALPALFGEAGNEKSVNALGPMCVRWVLGQQGLQQTPQEIPIETLLAMKDVHPYVMHVVVGSGYLKAAWKARGEGPARKVSEEGMKAFVENMAKAREHWVAAWEKYPQYPEAASNMIEVALNEKGEREDNARVWFDRATKAQFDYLPAYRIYEQCVWPSWGGSLEQMVAFGRECAATGRYDTGIPGRVVLPLQKITVDEEGDGYKYYMDPESYKIGDAVLEKYEQTLTAARGVNYARSYRAAWACRMSKYELARSLFEKLGTNVAIAPFEDVGLFPEQQQTLAYAYTSALAEKIRKADFLADAGSLDDAIDAFQALAKSTELKDRSATYVQDRAKELLLYQKFLTGEWVDFTPDASLTGWMKRQGDWRITKEGMLEAHVKEGENSKLMFRQPLGSRFEVSGHLEFVEAPSGHEKCDAGVILAEDPGIASYRASIWEPYASLCIVGTIVEMRSVSNPYILFQRGRTAATGSDDFLFAVWDNMMGAGVNDTKAQIASRMFQSKTMPTKRSLMGFMCQSEDKDVVVRFSKLKIRRLKDAPAFPTIVW